MNNHQAGNILLELMLTLVIGSLIIGLLFEIYVTAQKSFHLQEALGQIQDNASTAIDILSTEIHQAGYIGCAKLMNEFPIIPYQHYSINTENKLMGTDKTITVRHAATSHAELIKTMQNLSTLETKQTIRFKKNQILIISDCKHAEIFQVKKISYSHNTQIIITDAPLHALYDAHAEVSRFEINHFFIAKSALYLENIHQSKIRLVDGIKSMHFKYDSNGSTIYGISIDIDVEAATFNKIWHDYVSIS